MIRWILKSKQLALILFSAAVTLFSSGTELIRSNYIGLVVSVALGLSVFISARFPVVSASIVFPIAIGISFLTAEPLIQTFFLAVLILFISLIGESGARTVNIWSGIFSGLFLAFQLGYQANFFGRVFGSAQDSESNRVLSMLAMLIFIEALILLAILSGRMAFIRIQHIGSPRDRAKGILNESKLHLEINKQNERLEIAKDLSELLVQRINAVVSATEGGKYAVRADSTSAERILDRSFDAAKSAQSELRRLYDYLNGSIISDVTMYRIEDLQELAVAMREFGYNTVISEHGTPFRLNDGVELCVYKIVYEAVANARKHTPTGTDISIDFMWVEDGLQVLIKDNGIEVANRRRQSLGELVESYDANDDLNALVTEIDGATLAVLRDRASIYGGRIEASSVPGVGFTVSAIFPNLKQLLGSAS